MQDQEFISAFEASTLSNQDFHHRDHVKMVWLYLGKYTLLEALARFSRALKRFAATHGKPQLYHETITWAYVFLINERRERGAKRQSWEEFVTANPDLFEWPSNILRAYYNEETLHSDIAKRVFVFPDRNAHQQTKG